MLSVIIDAPKKEFLSSKQAARWIGIGEPLFLELAAAEDWMKPTYFGTGARKLRKWSRLQVFVFAWVYGQRHQAEK
jgi:hypothetical protein